MRRTMMQSVSYWNSASTDIIVITLISTLGLSLTYTRNIRMPKFVGC